MASKVLKKRPAGKGENVKVAYANFATSEKKAELKIDGREFDNAELLRTLGFEEKDGVMTLGTSNNDIEINESGEIIRRKKDGQILTEKEKENVRD